MPRKNNELSLQKSELKKIEDTKKAEADAAYSIQEQEQRKTIEVATAEASIAKQEKEVVLKQKEAEVREKSLDAEIRKKAEAEKFARQQQSEAELYERQRKAEADKFEQEKEAAGIRMVGEAEAEAIRAKGLAEAEAMEKKALAYQKYNNAAMAEMLIKVLPEIAGKIAEPLQQIDEITIIGSGQSDGLGSVADHVPAVMTKLFETMKDTVGIDLSEIVKAGTYDAKVTRNINITGLGNDNAEDANDAVAAAVIRAADDSMQV